MIRGSFFDLKNDLWFTIRIIVSAMIRDPQFGLFFQLWSAIRDLKYFQYNLKRFGSKSNYQFSDDDNIADRGSFLRIADHFCRSRIILQIVDHMMKQKNDPQNDPTTKCIWSDSFHMIRNSNQNLNHDPWSAIWIILGSMIRDLRSGSFFWWSGPLLL